MDDILTIADHSEGEVLKPSVTPDEVSQDQLQRSNSARWSND